jgi:hypothetical protein
MSLTAAKTTVEDLTDPKYLVKRIVGDSYESNSSYLSMKRWLQGDYNKRLLDRYEGIGLLMSSCNCRFILWIAMQKITADQPLLCELDRAEYYKRRNFSAMTLRRYTVIGKILATK